MLTGCMYFYQMCIKHIQLQKADDSELVKITNNFIYLILHHVFSMGSKYSEQKKVGNTAALLCKSRSYQARMEVPGSDSTQLLSKQYLLPDNPWGKLCWQYLF